MNDEFRPHQNTTAKYAVPPPNSLGVRLLEKAGSWLSRCPRLSQVLFSVAMVDRRLLTQVPRGEAHVYSSLGALMILAALWTAFGMASKLTGVVPGGAFAWVVLFGFFFLFAIYLERAILGTFRTGRKAWANIVLRFGIALVIATLQVAPVLLHVFEARIKQHAHASTLRAIVEANDLSATARGLSGIARKSAEMARRTEAAREAVRNPPPNAKVTATQQRFAETRRAAARAERDVDNAQRKLADARATLEVAKTSAEQNRAQAAVDAWTGTLGRRKAIANQARASVEIAKQGAFEAEQAWQDELQKELNDAAEQEGNLAQRLAITNRTVLADVAQAEALAREAAKDDFANALVAFLQVAGQDSKVAAIAIFIFCAALLLDLTPLLAKWNLTDHGVYARIVDHQATQTTQSLQHLETMEEFRREQERLQEKNHVEAFSLFARSDRGATEAARIALQEQQALDAQRVLAAFALPRQAFEEIEQTIIAALRVEQLAEASPGIKQVFVAQIQQLVGKLEAAAREAASDAASATKFAKSADQTS